jgi:hypothetical protein
MKKLLILTLSAVALLFAACGETEKTPLSVTPRTLEFTYLAGSQTIDLTASDAWTHTSSATWVTVTPASGATTPSLGQQVTIRVDTNQTLTNRSATITFTAGGEEAILTVNQAAAADISGVWVLDFFDRDEYYDNYFATGDCESLGCWRTIYDTISRRNFNTFHIFSFFKGFKEPSPQPIIEFDGKDFIFRELNLDPAKDFYQVPLAVIDNGESFVVLPSPIVLRYDAVKGELDADYTVRVRVEGGAEKRGHLVFAAFDGTLRTWENLVEWIESPNFHRVSAAGRAPAPKRARNDVRKDSDIVIEVSAEQIIVNPNGNSQSRRR